MFYVCDIVFFFKQKTAYEMRISDWSSDVCSSDLRRLLRRGNSRAQPTFLGSCATIRHGCAPGRPLRPRDRSVRARRTDAAGDREAVQPHWKAARAGEASARAASRQTTRSGSPARECGGQRVPARHFRTRPRSEEHTSELQSLMRISYAVFCLK